MAQRRTQSLLTVRVVGPPEVESPTASPAFWLVVYPTGPKELTPLAVPFFDWIVHSSNRFLETSVKNEPQVIAAWNGESCTY